MIKNQKAYFLTDSQVSTLSYLIWVKLGMLDRVSYPQLGEEEREELLATRQALLHSSVTIEDLMIENHQLRNRIQGLELEKEVNKLENDTKMYLVERERMEFLNKRIKTIIEDLQYRHDYSVGESALMAGISLAIDELKELLNEKEER